MAACHALRVRRSEFWQLMDDEFGAGYARSVASEQHVHALGDRTAVAALDAGEDPRTVWFALCDAMDVPAERRWGRDDPHRRASGRSGRAAG
ncbi:hypothetical protein GCM10028814_15660 [Angustibacter aerolatus]